MEDRDPEQGRKGGSLESGMALPRYYEPTVTAVTDMVIPATRIQWGPVIAGVIVALAVALLFTSLGVALGFTLRALGFWTTAFTAVGLFLGNMLTARTAKADLVPAIAHAVVVWGIVLILSAIAIGNLGGAVIAARSPIVLAANVVAAGFGWRFFIGFLIMLGAAILGGIVGTNRVRREEKTV